MSSFIRQEKTNKFGRGRFVIRVSWDVTDATSLLLGYVKLQLLFVIRNIHISLSEHSVRGSCKTVE